MSTLAEIARQAGVSTATVSLVLSGKSARYRIRPETERRIRQLARNERFTPNQLARGLRLRRTRTVGLIVSDITTAFFAQLSHAVEVAAQEHGYHVIIANTGDDPAVETAAVETLLARSVDGLIISSAALEPSYPFSSRKAAVPVVHIDRRIEGPGVHCVTSDNRGGMHRLTTHLLGLGLCDIAYVGGLPHLSTHRERLDGFAEAYREAGLTLDERRLVDGGFTRECGYRFTRELFERSARRPQGIITAALPLFEGLLAYFGDAHGGVPESIRLATFDDHPLLDFLAIPVSSVRQDCDRMGRAAFEALMLPAGGAQTPATTTIETIFVNRQPAREVSS